MNPQDGFGESKPDRSSLVEEPSETASFLSAEENQKNNRSFISRADGNKPSHRKRDYVLHPIRSFRQWRAEEKAKLLSKERQIRTSSEFEFRLDLAIDIILALIAVGFATLGVAALVGHDKTKEQKTWLSYLPTAMKYASRNFTILECGVLMRLTRAQPYFQSSSPQLPGA